MSKKIPIGITVALLVIAIVASSAATFFTVIHRYNELLVDLPQKSEQYIRLSDVDELVRREYFGRVDSEKIDESLARGYLSGLGDSYCYYIAPDEYENYTNLIKGKLPGVGITAYFDMDTSLLLISDVDKGSPAEIAGISKDMYIAAVNGKEVTIEEHEELLSLMSDKYEGEVRITYTDLPEIDETDLKEVKLSCGYIDVSCDYSHDGNIGYIRISSFYENTVDVFRSAVSYMQENTVTSVILDLRNSSGVDLDVAAEIIDVIVPVGNEGTGAIFTAQNADGEIVKQVSSDASSLNMSFVVLVNDRTECAAELVACDLRDFGKAVLFGEPTSGHGTLQQIFTLEDGGAVTLTVAEIKPYISESFDEKGVSPDVEILTTEAFKNRIGQMDLEDDEQYQRAYSYLSGK